MPFRKKPVVVDAWQWNGQNLQEIAKLGGAREYEQDFLGDELVIHTLEGGMTTQKGHWIIRGVKGELYLSRRPASAAAASGGKAAAPPVMHRGRV